MTELVIVRHAQSEWNAVGRWQGWADPPLSPLGERQAATAGRTLAAQGLRPDRFAASDLQRAVRTAGYLRDPGAPTPDGILTDAGLREYDAGEWTGLSRTEIEARWPGRLEAWARGSLEAAPGGEDGDAFTARLLAALERLEVAQPDGTVLAVSHGRAIHALTQACGRPSGHVANLTGWRFALDGGLHLLGSVSLLPDPTSADGGPGGGALG